MAVQSIISVSEKPKDNMGLLGSVADYMEKEITARTEQKAAFYINQYQELCHKIEELKAELARYKKQDNTFNYDRACFPNHNGKAIINLVIDLANEKREKGRFIISAKTDWYIVWKVLKYFNLYSGTEHDFINVVNDCILPEIEDSERRKKLRVSSMNFYNIDNNSPIKHKSPKMWESYYEKERKDSASKASKGKSYNCQPTSMLNRAVNIYLTMVELLQEANIEIMTELI